MLSEHAVTVEAHPLARLYGEPVNQLPMDLYIPPEALEIFLEAFEGPLDLLLYLIRRQNFNVLDVPMASLTAQYLEYVERIRSTNLELAADYLLMAAVLIEIKSRMLLPRPRREDAVEEDPRAALVRRLLEYEQFKLAAQGLQDLPVVGREFDWVELWIEREMTAPQPRVEVADLLGAWRQLLRQAQLYQHHRVRREELSVREFMSNILRALRERELIAFEELFEVTGGVPVVVVTFLAVLELARESLIQISQELGYSPIYVRLASIHAD